MPDPGDQPPGDGALQSGQLHRRQRDVAQRHGQQADADREVLGGRESQCRRGDATLGEAVLPDPQFIEACGFRESGNRPQPFRRHRGSEGESEFQGHESIMLAADDSRSIQAFGSSLPRITLWGAACATGLIVIRSRFT